MAVNCGLRRSCKRKVKPNAGYHNNIPISMPDIITVFVIIYIVILKKLAFVFLIGHFQRGIGHYTWLACKTDISEEVRSHQSNVISRLFVPRGALPLWESVGMRRGFATHFRHLDDLFAPQNLTLSTILFRSCWVPFRSTPFSACRRSFCPQNWPNLSFYSDLVGSHFELRAVHPYWFWPGVPPPPPPPPPGVLCSPDHPQTISGPLIQLHSYYIQ